jgi:Putative Actinobacterial Holin-X, holin superfamily III
MARPTSDTDRTIGQLVADATHDLQGIVRGEIALAKAEVTSGAKVLGRGAGLLAGAAFLALMGFLFLLHTLAQVLAIWLPLSASYGIVTALVLAVAAVLALLGRKALQEAQPAPERAIDQGQRTIALLKGQPEPDDAAAAPAATTAD